MSFISQLLTFGNGSTWPGHIALSVNPNFLKEIIKKNPQLKIILIAGTNGKTTTAKLIQTILEKNNKRVFQNASGANLLNGIASSMLLRSNILCNVNYDFAVFEVDENSLSLVVNELTPDFLIILNLYRDQLDRYGEIDTIAKKWHYVISKLPESTTMILNADDPQIAFLGHSLRHPERGEGSYPKVFYFGLDDKKLHQSSYQHAVDSTYCPNCRNKLNYATVYFSHLGEWSCKKCGYKRPKFDISTSPNYPLSGVYNRYNTHAAILFSSIIGIDLKTVNSALQNFSPAFGRQEIIKVDGKKVQLFLSKNPTSFNQSLRTIIEQKAPARNASASVADGKILLIVLNDRIPDGRDVSWIWDVDFEEIKDFRRSIHVAGDRVYDMALRLKYAGLLRSNDQIHTNIVWAIKQSLSQLKKDETLYILPTYSAMLNVRKVLIGRQIL